MKILLLLPIILLSLNSCMSYQAVSFTEEEYYTEVFTDLPDSKTMLYTKSHDWMITSFNNAESVIQHQDKEEGIIMGKYLLNGRYAVGAYGTSTDTRIYAKIDIQVKEHKARIIIQPLGQWKYDTSGMTIYDYSKEMAIADMKSLADDFFNFIQKKRDDNW